MEITAAINNRNQEFGVEIDQSVYSISDSKYDVPPLTWQFSTWPKNIQKSLAFLAVLWLSASSGVFYLRQMEADLVGKIASQTAITTNIETRLKNSDNEKSAIEKNKPLQALLIERNVFAEEARLEFIESIRAFETALPKIEFRSYNIRTQAAVPDPEPDKKVGRGPQFAPLLPNGSRAKNFGVFASEVELSFVLQHEGDLVALLDYVKKTNLGLIYNTQCSVRRQGAIPDDVAAPNINFVPIPLDTNCKFQWLTMKLYEGT